MPIPQKINLHCDKCNITVTRVLSDCRVPGDDACKKCGQKMKMTNQSPSIIDALKNLFS